jgi:hypothetical protein
MAKVNGIPVTFTIDTTSGTPTDISDIVGECTVNTSRALQDVTGLDKDGTERITLRGDVTVDITGFEDDGTRIDDIFLDPANLRTTTIVFPNRTFGPAELVIGRSTRRAARTAPSAGRPSSRRPTGHPSLTSGRDRDPDAGGRHRLQRRRPHLARARRRPVRRRRPGAPLPRTRAQFDALADAFLPFVESWTYPEPVDRDGFAARDINLALAIVHGWLRGVASAPLPLLRTSSDGEPSADDVP